MGTSPVSRWALVERGAIGAVTFLSIHLFLVLTWERWFLFMKDHTAWWMETTRSMAVTLIVVFLVAFASFLRRSRSPWPEGLAMLAGIGLSMTIILFLIGPGNLWPIVLVFGLALTGEALFLGAAAAVTLRRLAGRER